MFDAKLDSIFEFLSPELKETVSKLKPYLHAADLQARLHARLLAWKIIFEYENSVSLNIAAIRRALEREYGLKTSEQQLASMFKLDFDGPKLYREIKVEELLYFMHLFHLQLKDFLEFPERTLTTMERKELIKPTSDLLDINFNIKPIDSPFYQGTYFGYFFKIKHQNDLRIMARTSIDVCKLSIDYDNISTKVTLEDFSNNKVLTGELHHFLNKDQAYAQLISKDGKYQYCLQFSFLKINYTERYFIPCSLLRASDSQNAAPSYEKLILLREELDLENPEDLSFIKGLLCLDNGYLFIDDYMHKKLTENNAILASVLSQSKTAYIYSEEQIASDLEYMFDMKQDEITKTLLELRQHSLQSAFHYIRTSDAETAYVKSFQEKKKKGPAHV